MKRIKKAIRLLFLYLFMMNVMGISAQLKENDKVYKVVDILPYFVSDSSHIDAPAILNFISKNIQYPKDALKIGKQGTVVCEFVVNKDGKISDIKVTRSIYPSLDKEAVRVIQSFPKWYPGIINGKNVRTSVKLPVIFRIRNM